MFLLGRRAMPCNGGIRTYHLCSAVVLIIGPQGRIVIYHSEGSRDTSRVFDFLSYDAMPVA